MRSSRSAAVAAVIALVALLTGCAGTSGGGPVASGTPTPSSTPSATPAVAAAPSVRVPTTCESLLSADAVSAAAGAPVTSAPPSRVHAPTAYADDRVGALRCAWKADPGQDLFHTPSVSVTIVPGTTKEAFDGFRHGIDIGGLDRQAPYGNDSFTACGFTGYGTACNFAELANGYGVLGSVARPGDHEDTAVDGANATLFGLVDTAVGRLRAPQPLWQPSGASINGAATCDGLATAAQISRVFPGSEPNEAKSEAGEYAISTLGAAQLVGSNYCIFTGMPEESGLRLGVLPGGESYVDVARRSDPDAGSAQTVSGVGDSALYYSATGTLDVVAEGGWIDVTMKNATIDQLTAMARTVLSNLDGN